ncbi:Gfo/Idh/MocA family protein [Streptomyces sp. Ru62]|uniref:Gfo/Idh/MocA family protein n=1 Tax=Streptomyces sp. Ru62 TaxID=2080745 RepID=UPI00215646A0|nr:Gfo/Idh/MocA family oxidoreductase [Streptomyces sp. Ru62]
MTPRDRDPSRPLHVALLGTSHVHFRDYHDLLAREPRVSAVVLPAAPDTGDRPAFGAASVREALRCADAAVITSTTAQHAQLLPHTVRAGVPTLVEKPLAATAGQTARLLPLLAAGGPTTTAMFLRCAPGLRRVRALLRQDVVGPLTAVRLCFAHAGLTDGVFTGEAAWMLDPGHGAAGALSDLGIHLIDLLLWLAPRRPIGVVNAELRHRPGLVLEPAGTAVLRWGSVPVTLHASWIGPRTGFSAHFAARYGTIRVAGGSVTLRTGRTATTWRHDPPRAGAALTAFLRRLGGRPAWRPPGHDDIRRTAALLEEIGSVARRRR